MPLRRAPGAAFGLTRATKGRKAENFRRVHKPKASCTSFESSAIAISPWRMTPSKIGVRFIPGGPLLARSRDHRKVYPAPHPAFGHLLPACGEKEKSRRRLMDKPQGQLHFRRHFCHEVETIAKSTPAPHPTFDHLLPACEEKEKTSSASSQRGISAEQLHQERGRALHLGLQYRRPSTRRPISLDGYGCGYGGMVGCAALTPLFTR